MELMAPAGSVDHFSAALEAGADAVYIGAPFLNARNPSRELRFEEIGAMVDHAHDRGRRVYVALNSIVKESDLPRLIQTLSELEAINPDGLIVQDLGVIEVINRYFRNLRIHASTLMFAHSGNDVELLAALGCARVVMARELTLSEIETIVRNSPVEIEIFVHGAMCFSYSGRCLFSSYHGGKSGLRGNCVQPCRRKFSVGTAGPGSSGGRGGGKSGGKGGTRGGSRSSGRSGYIFSMNDLEGVDYLADFQRMGVASIKIEGRLKPITYVQNVVRAYRMVLDAGPGDKEAARVEARGLIDGSLGRRRSSGYFLSASPKDAIVSTHSGNIGTYLGVCTGFTNTGDELWATLRARESCHEGDRLRLHFEKSGERTAFTARQVALREDGQTAVLLPAKIGKKQLQGKVDLYRVDTGRTEKIKSGGPAPHLRIEPFSATHVSRVKKRSKNAYSALTNIKHQADSGSKNAQQVPGQRAKSRPREAEVWVRFDTVKPIYQKLPFAADRFIVPINRKTLAETGHLSRYFGKSRNRVIWALPPVAYDQKNRSLQRDVSVLIRSGFRSFQVSTVGQLNLFSEKKISLYGDFSLNVLNSRTMRLMTQLGLKGYQFSIETDRDSLKQALGSYREQMDPSESGKPTGRNTRNGMVGLTVYGAPPLFTSRVHAQDVSFRQKVISPKQEDFVVQKTGGETITRPVRPFSLLPFKKELETIGIDYMVIDLSGRGADKKELQDLAKRIGGKEKTSKLSSFNFSGHLE